MIYSVLFNAKNMPDHSSSFWRSICEVSISAPMGMRGIRCTVKEWGAIQFSGNDLSSDLMNTYDFICSQFGVVASDNGYGYNHKIETCGEYTLVSTHTFTKQDNLYMLSVVITEDTDGSALKAVTGGK